MSSTNLIEMAPAISENIAALNTALKTHHVLLPSLKPGGLEKYPEIKDVQGPRQRLIELAMDLYHLALGPGEYIKQQVFLVWRVGDV